MHKKAFKEQKSEKVNTVYFYYHVPPDNHTVSAFACSFKYLDLNKKTKIIILDLFGQKNKVEKAPQNIAIKQWNWYDI